MDNYKGNSFASKEKKTGEKRVQKIVNGPVKVKKKSEVRKLTDIFVSDDSAKVKDYVIWDVLVPAVKKAISDIVTNGINMILYGDKGSVNSTPAGKVTYKNYNSIYGNTHASSDRFSSGYNGAKRVFDYDTIEYSSRGEAEAVIMQMDELIETYGFVRVADYYELSGVTKWDFTANNYGWANIRSASPVRTSGGWIIRLPRAMPID